MTILWCGGEDIDFPNGTPPDVQDYYYDGNFARKSLKRSNSIAKSIALSEAYTTAWMSCVVWCHQVWYSGIKLFGACLSGGVDKGLFVGLDDATNNKISLWTVDGSTWTKKATSDADVITTSKKYKFDMHVSSYGNSASVDIYVDGALVLTFSGDITVSGMSWFNCVGMSGDYGYDLSEFILADEDTRLMRLKTIAPDSAGDTSTNWTGTYEDIDETTISDSDKIYSATDNADFQCGVTGMPTGSWAVKAVKVAARCVDGSGTNGIAVGVKTNDTVSVSGAMSCSGYWQTKELLLNTNPVTGNPWTPAEIEALQINLRAKAL